MKLKLTKQDLTVFKIIFIEDRQFRILNVAHEKFLEAEKLNEQGNDKEALDSYMVSAALNHPISLYKIGCIFLEGRSLSKDPAKAVEYFKKAMALKLYCATIDFGVCLYNGVGITENRNEALKLFTSVPKEFVSQTPVILHIIGDSYYAGDYGVRQNYQKALEYYELAADKGNEVAAEAAMRMYLGGTGCKKNVEKALKYFETIQNLEKVNNYTVFCEFFAELYAKGNKLRKPDYQKAIHFYKLACDIGSATAAYSIGQLYNDIDEVQNFPESKKYFQLSAERGNSSGQYIWGYLLLEGKLVSQDIPEAIKYLTLSAEDKNSHAFCMLGECYASGTGVEVDLNQAFDFYKKAGDEQPKAQLGLGFCYMEGKVVKQDLKIAFDYFKKAASAPWKIAAAKEAYGLCLLHGIGCKPDLKKGIEYLELAEKLDTTKDFLEPGITKGYLNFDVPQLKLCADRAFEKGRFPLAFAHIERALQKAKNNTIKKSLLLDLADLQMKLGDFDAALNTIERALEIMPKLLEILRKKIVCLALKNDDRAACFLLEKNLKALLPFVKENQEPWAIRIYNLHLERQIKQEERIAAEKIHKNAKKLEQEAKKIIANTFPTPEETIVPLKNEDNLQPPVSPVPSRAEEEEMTPLEMPVETKIPQIIHEDNSQSPVTPKLSQTEEEPLEKPVERTIPQIAICSQQEKRPKVKMPESICLAFENIKQRTGVQSLKLIGSTAFDLIVRTVFEGQLGLHQPKNWNFFTSDSAEKLNLIGGQFLQTDNKKLYIDIGTTPFENKVNLYCDIDENIGLFTVHQLALDQEGNIIGPGLAFQDLKRKILRFIRPQESIDKAILETFLAKFEGSDFALLKEQTTPLEKPETHSPVTQFGIFAPAQVISETSLLNQQEEKILMIRSRSQPTLRFLASTHSKERLICIKKDLDLLVETLIVESDLNFSSRYNMQVTGSVCRVEFIFKFKNQADLEKMQELVNNKGLPHWDEASEAASKVGLS